MIFVAKNTDSSYCYVILFCLHPVVQRVLLVIPWLSYKLRRIFESHWSAQRRQIQRSGYEIFPDTMRSNAEPLIEYFDNTKHTNRMLNKDSNNRPIMRMAFPNLKCAEGEITTYNSITEAIPHTIFRIFQAESLGREAFHVWRILFYRANTSTSSSSKWTRGNLQKSKLAVLSVKRTIFHDNP